MLTKIKQTGTQNKYSFSQWN
jgi:hypothetical protein